MARGYGGFGCGGFGGGFIWIIIIIIFKMPITSLLIMFHEVHDFKIAH